MMENSFSNTYKGKNGRAYWYYWSKNANGDSSTTDWNVSLLNKTNLNTNYLNNIGEKWSQMIATSTWEIGQYAVDSVIPSTIKQYESTRKIFSDYTGKVGLMYLSDYLFAASSNNWAKYVYNASDTENDYRSAKDEDWLYLGDYEWMLATKSSNMVFLINTDGFIRSDVITVTESSLRPVFYLSDGVGIVQEAIVVKVNKPEFSLSNIKAANNPDLNGTPIDNVESFRRAFDQAKRNSEVEYSSLDSLSSGNVVVVIPNIVTLFAFNSSVLNDQAAFLIKEYAKAYLQTDKSSIIKIEGFACNIGSDEVNDCISAERANAVKVLLVDMGVPSEKIVTASYGKRKNNSIRYDSMAEYRRAVISIQ